MYEYKGNVKKVIDGDTLDVVVDLGFGIYHEVRVRLLGVDTPEIFHPVNEKELKHGQAAKDFVSNLVMNKSILLVTRKDKQGKYGRYLADIAYETDTGEVKLLVEEIKSNGFEKRSEYQ